MASWIDPMCGVPEFQMKNVDDAIRCGKYSGYIFAFIISIIVLIFTIFMYINSDKNTSKNEPVKEKNKIILLIGFGIIILIWLVPFAMGFFARRRWQGYQLQIDSLVNDGMDRSSAINKIQDLYQTKMTADATQMTGTEIATALLMKR